MRDTHLNVDFSTPKYLVQANYVGEGLKGLLKEGGSSRRAVVEKLFGSVGGKVEAFYYAWGSDRLLAAFVVESAAFIAQRGDRYSADRRVLIHARVR